MRLVISILNYRTPDLILDCLRSLQSEVQIDRDLVVVVDNASGDDSIERIERAITENQWQQWVQLVPSPVNGGFSAGHNITFQRFSADAFMVLGSDTIVRRGALNILKDALERYPEAGLIGPRLEYLDGTPQISCFRNPSPASESIAAAGTGVVTKLLKSYDILIPVSETSIETEWISFACVLIRNSVIRQIGLMDEGYFMYYEDIDYCRRAQMAGWRIRYIPSARVVHFKGGSGAVQASISSRKRPPGYYYASRSRYFAKYYDRTGLWLANLSWLAGRSISWGRETIRNKAPHTCDRQAEDIWTNGWSPLKSEKLSKK